MTDLEYLEFPVEQKAFPTESNLNHDSEAEQAVGCADGNDFPRQNTETDSVDCYPADLLLPFLLPNKFEDCSDSALQVVETLKL